MGSRRTKVAHDTDAVYKTMKRVLAVLFAVMIVGQAWAYDFKSGDLYYNITSNNTVEVTEGNYTNLSAIIIPQTVIFKNVTYSVTSIGDAAFSDCDRLKSVTIPNSVTSIGNGTFYGCIALTSVNISSSLTNIGDEAFYGCDKLKFNIYNNACYLGNVENPYIVLYKAKNQGITECEVSDKCHIINDMAFYECPLTKISIPNSVVIIGRYAFGYCKLTSVSIPNSITKIGESAFSDCTELTKAYFASINSLCDIQFGNENSNPLLYAKDLYVNGQKVTDLIIPNTVVKIGKCAFIGCSSLTSVTISNSVTSIGKRAFAKCNNLESIVIPYSVTSIEHGAFDGCSSLKTVNIPNTISEISDATFHRCSKLSSIIIPNSITRIGENAFFGCKLQTLDIPNSVKEIGQYAFAHCEFQTLDIPSSVEKIESYAFYSCLLLKQVKIPSSVKNISIRAFTECPKLENVYCQVTEKPAGWNERWITDSFGSDIFTHSEIIKWKDGDKTANNNQKKTATSTVNNEKQKSSETSSTVNKENEEENLFQEWVGVPPERYYDFSAVCSSGQTLYFKYMFNPKTVRICMPMWYPNLVGEFKTYGNCEKPKGNLIIPETVTYEGKTYIVTEISAGVFYNSKGLTSVTIPNSINSIGSDAFAGCDNLTSVTINSEAPINDAGIYLKKGQLWYYVLDKSTVSVVSDGNQNYAGDIVIPSKITAGNTFSVIGIGGYAFAECIDLKSVTIPNTIKTIGENAFRSCIHLTAIYCQAKSEPFGWNANWNPNKYKVVWGAIDKFK